jgi:predicted Zn-dependent peptidase
MADLGASIYCRSDLDNTYLGLSALKNNIDASLALYADVLLNPAFPQKDFDRKKKEQLLDIKQEQSQPFGMGHRVLPKVIYGAGHSYSMPFTGTGTEASVEKMKRDDLVQFHNTWFSPNNSTLVVVGDITESELKAKLEKNLASWKSKTVPQKNIKDVPLAQKPTVYIVDKPDAIQSIIFAGTVSPAAKDTDYETLQMANRILGVDFTSRVNMNLREDKHWSYGAGSVSLDAKGPGMFITYGPVQTDKTKESMQEILKELNQYIGDKPATEKEFQKVKTNAVLQLPGIWETNGSVLSTLQNNLNYERGQDYLKNYPTMLQNMQLADVQNSAKKLIHPNSLAWVIVGDRSKIEAGIKELNLGEIKFIDSEGNPVK